MNFEKMKVNEVSDETLVNYLEGKGYTIKQSNNNSNSNKLPKTWEELGKVSGHYIDGDSFSWVILEKKTSDYYKNIFRTKEQAEASLALAQLSQLMFIYNESWKPNWKNPDTRKYCIAFNVDALSLPELFSTRRFLAFKTREIRIKFLENFRDLIWQAKPLL